MQSLGYTIGILAFFMTMSFGIVKADEHGASAYAAAIESLYGIHCFDVVVKQFTAHVPRGEQLKKQLGAVETTSSSRLILDIVSERGMFIREHLSRVSSLPDSSATTNHSIQSYRDKTLRLRSGARLPGLSSFSERKAEFTQFLENTPSPRTLPFGLLSELKGGGARQILEKRAEKYQDYSKTRVLADGTVVIDVLSNDHREVVGRTKLGVPHYLPEDYVSFEQSKDGKVEERMHVHTTYQRIGDVYLPSIVSFEYSVPRFFQEVRLSDDCDTIGSVEFDWRKVGADGLFFPDDIKAFEEWPKSVSKLLSEKSSPFK